ncbi:MAG: ATPase [Deltaproteobacteria bacterium]|nr:MAG: ATPase [Deltaproteobacteria bacterium]
MSVDISLNSSIIIQIVNFVVLVIALNIVLYKPIRGILAKRKEAVDSLKNEADEAVFRTRESEIKFREEIKAARIRGAEKKNEIIDSAVKEENNIIMELQQESNGKFKEVKEKINKEAETARVSLEENIGIFASEIASKVLGRTV